MTQPPHPLPNPRPSRGLLIVISGPSGVGKTTITHTLESRLGAVFSVSMTTRRKTAADTEGSDYYFVDEPRFKQAIERGELLEWAHVFGNYYGTPREPVERHLAAGKDVLLEIDVHGAEQIKRAFPDALSIFVLPPSEDELLRRLRARKREEESVIQRRFQEAQREIRQARDCRAYDHFVVNQDLQQAVDQASTIIQQRKVAV